MRRWYRMHWKSHGSCASSDLLLAGDAREAVQQWRSTGFAKILEAVTAEASGEVVAEELWK